ncbi:MAG TPA: S8 family serine peptidase [Vicinamibacterales bacterium]
MRAAEAAPRRSKLDSALRGSTATNGLNVIVQTRSGSLDTVTGDVRKAGNSVRRFHRLINAASLTITGAQLKALEKDGSVLNISVDAVVRASTIRMPSPVGGGGSGSTSTPDVSVPRSVPNSGGGSGSGGVPSPVSADSRVVGVAVIDSGLEPSADLAPYYFKDFVNGIDQAYDDYGHGTHVAGLIAGLGVMSNGAYHGVAPGVRVISLKALDSQGAGRTSTIIQAIEFAVANRAELGIDVINLSLGHPVYEPPDTDPLVQAVNAAVRAGIIVVASAGNVGKNPDTGNVWYGGILSPGNAPSVVTVGAVDTNGSTTLSDDSIPVYSSRGPARFTNLPKPDIAAPGQGMVAPAALHSTLYQTHPDRQVPGLDGNARYFRLNGTSMAAAVTSGAVALMIDANQHHFSTRLTPNVVKALLEFSAFPLPGSDVVSQGRGELNAGGAVALASAIDPALAQGQWWLTTPIDTFTTVGNESGVWAQSVVWGTRIIWGNTVFINQPAWAADVVWGAGDSDTVVWGNSGGDDDTVVWGNNEEDTVVWGNSTEGDTVVWGNGGDTVVWGNGDEDEDTVVWGNSLP